MRQPVAGIASNEGAKERGRRRKTCPGSNEHKPQGKAKFVYFYDRLDRITSHHGKVPGQNKSGKSLEVQGNAARLKPLLKAHPATSFRAAQVMLYIDEAYAVS